MYEEHALEKLAKGGRFTASPLLPKGTGFSGKDISVTLPSSKMQLFGDISDLSGACAGGPLAKRIMVPKSGTFATIDAVVPGQRLAKVTINTKHEIHLHGKHGKGGLVPVAAALGLTGSIPFFWVMPRDRYKQAVSAGPLPVRVTATSKGSAAAASSVLSASGGPRASAALSSTDVLAQYKQRIQQHALLVEFDPLPHGGPMPRS